MRRIRCNHLIEPRVKDLKFPRTRIFVIAQTSWLGKILFDQIAQADADVVSRFLPPQRETIRYFALEEPRAQHGSRDFVKQGSVDGRRDQLVFPQRTKVELMPGRGPHHLIRGDLVPINHDRRCLPHDARKYDCFLRNHTTDEQTRTSKRAAQLDPPGVNGSNRSLKPPLTELRLLESPILDPWR